MIRKTLLLGALVVAAVILIAPLMLSYELDDAHQAYVQALAQQPYLTVEKASFSRGWFESGSSLTLAPADSLCQGSGCPRIHIETQIYHGPLPFGAYVQTGLSVRPVQGIAISRISLVAKDSGISFDPALPPMIATTVIGLGGDQSVEVYWAGGSTRISAPAGSAQLVFDGVQGKFTRDAVGNQMTIGLKAPGFVLTNADGARLELDDFELGVARRLAELSATAYNASLGQASFAPSAKQSPLQIDQLKLESKVEFQDALASTEGSIAFSHLAGTNGSYGPGILKYSADNLAYRVLERVREQAQQLGSGKLPPSMSSLALLQLYQQNAAALLQPGPSLAVPSFEVTTPSGKVSGDLHLSIPPAESDADPNVATVIHKLQADFSIQVPRPLVEFVVRERLQRASARQAQQLGQTPPPVTDGQVQAVLQHLVAGNFLVPQEDGVRLRFALSIRDGQLYVNGQKSISLAAMLSLFKAQESQ